MALLWVLNLADGRHSLLDTAERAGLPYEQIRAAAALASQAKLIVEKVPETRALKPQLRVV